MAKKNAVKVLIVGGGAGGDAFIDVFRESTDVDIVGVVDIDSAAPAIKKAKKLHIPVADKYEKFLKKGMVDEVFNVTGSEKVQEDLVNKVPQGVDIISGHSAKLVWELIREHIEVEKDLRESKKFAETTMNSVRDAICVIDTSNYEILGVNKAFLDAVGLKEDDVIGKLCHKITHKNSSPCMPPDDICPLQETLKTGTYAIAEHVHFDEAGKKSYVEVATAPVKDENGKVYRVVHVMCDITQRKLSEEAVLNEKEKAEKYLDIAGTMILALDLDGNITLVNKKGCEILGHKREEIVGQNWFNKFISEEQIAAVKKIFNQLKKGQLEGVEHVEGEIINSKGERKIISWHNTFIKGEGGEIVGTLSSGEDITVQKRSDIEIRRAKEYAELILKVTPSAIYTMDINGAITSWNKKAEEITGYSAEEMVGAKSKIFIGEPCRDQCGLSVDGSFNPVTNKECKILRKDGSEVLVSKNADLLKDESGKAIGGIESFVDITSQKRAQEMMRSAYTELDQIFQSTGDGMLVFDKELRIVRANKTLLDLIGKTRRELVAEYCGTVFDDFIAGILKDSMERIVDGESYVNTDVTVTSRAGIAVPCILTVAPFKDRDGGLVGGIASFRDITERKSAEKALLDNIRLKSNFTSMVSHELRTPLTAIKEGIGIVLDGSTGEINEEQADFLSTAKRNVDRLGRLINDVLDFTKLQSGKMALKVAENDISAVIEDIAKIQKPVAEEKGLYMKTEVVPGIPNAQFDQDRVTQVIINLVNNALKFTEEGGVTIAAYPKGREICVSVDDTGPGIREGDVQKVFQEFRQIEDAKTRKAGGTGLGLAISKEIIQRHGGKIWVESVHGKGSQFKFTLPVVRKYKILVVDDEEIFVDFCANVLRGEEYEVLSATTGMGGVDKVREELPDLIIVDMVLPDINGYEVIGRLRSEKELSLIPVLAVSGHVEKLEELDKMEVPAESSTIPRLMKPIEPTLFVNTVKEILALLA